MRTKAVWVLKKQVKDKKGRRQGLKIQARSRIKKIIVSSRRKGEKVERKVHFINQQKLIQKSKLLANLKLAIALESNTQMEITILAR